MKAIDQLVNLIANFTQEQLETFLNDTVTLSVLRPEGEAEFDRQAGL